MNFHLPRRHRRKLLLPPGLLALAGLLWLGCVAVGTWQEKLKQWYWMQLTMPIYTAHHDKSSIRFELPNPYTICRACSWKDIYLTNRNDSIDKREQIRADNAIHAMMTQVNHSSGVRIHLSRAARFRHLIFALNTLNREDVRKYWLDIHHTPTTLYAFNEPPPLMLQRPKPDYVLNNEVVEQSSSKTPFWIRFDDQVTEFWQFQWLRSWLQPLRQPEWRASLWLLAAIATLSSRRIIRAWRTT